MAVLSYNRPNAEALIGVMVRKNGIIRGTIVSIETVVFEGDEIDYAVLDNGDKISTRKFGKWA